MAVADTVGATLKRKNSVSVSTANEPTAGVKRTRLQVGNAVLLNVQQPLTPNKATGPRTIKTSISPNGSISTIEPAQSPKLLNRKAPNVSNKPLGKPRILNNVSKTGAAKPSKPPASPTLCATDDGNLQLMFDMVDYDEEGSAEPEAVDAAEAAEPATAADAEDADDTVNNEAKAARKAKAPTSTGECYPCDQCDRTFPLRQLLDMHVERHGRDRVAECDICHKRFFTKYDLTKHTLVHRVGEKRFMCTVCPAGFSRANLLVRHELLHKDELRFKCGSCQKMLASREELERHERRHKIVRNFQCQHCEKSFAFKQGLERHETIHAKEQPFPCSYCGIGFPTATRLARHLSEHAGSRPFPCRICTKSFLLSHHLNRHMRSHQKNARPQGRPAGVGRVGVDIADDLDRSAENEEFASGAGADDGSGLLECMVCDLAFAAYGDLMDHSEQHALESGECPFCKIVLDTEQVAVEHMRQHGVQQYACEFCDLMFAQEEHKDEHCQQEHFDEQEMYAIDDRARAATNNAADGDGSMVIQVFQAAEGDVRQDGEAILHEFIIPDTNDEQETEAEEVHEEVEVEPEPEPEPEPQPQQPKRITRTTVIAKSAANSSPKILNYIKKEAQKAATPAEHEDADDAANIEDMKFEYMDIVRDEQEQIPPKENIAMVRQRMRAKAAELAAAGADSGSKVPAPKLTPTPKPSAAPKQSSPTKPSPTKQIPIAQQQLEQQLKNAMRRAQTTTTTMPPKTAIATAETSKAATSKVELTPPASNTNKLASGIKPTASKTSPVLTKVDVKTLPSGVTLKKVQLNRPSIGPAAANSAARKPEASASNPAAVTASAVAAKPVLRRVEVPSRKSIIMKQTAAKAAAPAQPISKTPEVSAAKSGRIRMTQSQVDAMAREGKIQIKDGQVFVRQKKN